MQVTEGEIGPFSSVKVPVIFTPVIPGEVQTKFKAVFKNQQCPTVSTAPWRGPWALGPCPSALLPPQPCEEAACAAHTWPASWRHRWLPP